MAERVTAERQLARILELLPRAARVEGASLAELARSMGTDQGEIVRDLTEVYSRAFYQPPGSAGDVQILIEESRVSVWTTGEFRRPVRLSPRESLAVALALRVLAAGSDPAKAEGLDALASRLERDVLDPRGTEALPQFDLHPSALSAGGVHEILGRAVRDRRRCWIEYLKSGAAEPDVREIDPLAVLASQGRWYTLGFCHRTSSVRVFRLDRILAATLLDDTFSPPADFDPMDYVSDGRVYRAEEFESVVVRYSARIARWIGEQGPVERLEDGSVLVRYSVADRRWLIRHVLEHGPDAEVVEPADLREEVLAALRGLAGAGISAKASPEPASPPPVA